MARQGSLRWPFTVLAAAVLLGGALSGGAAGWLAPFVRLRLPSGSGYFERMAAGAVCGLCASGLWCLAMLPSRRRRSVLPDRELPWHDFWGMFWGLVMWALPALPFSGWAAGCAMWRWGAYEQNYLLWTFAGFSALGLIGGTLGGLLLLDPAAKARRARRRRKIGLIASGTMVGLGVLGMIAGFVVPTKSVRAAIEDDDVDQVWRHLLWAKDANLPDAHGFPALLQATLNGSRQVAGLLLDRGADVDVSSGMTPLVMATGSGDLEMMELLLDRGAQIDGLSRGDIPLSAAVFGNETAAVRLLLARGANVNKSSSRDLTPLHTAALVGNVEAARILLAEGADVSATDRDGNTPLDWAVRARDHAAAYQRELEKEYSDTMNQGVSEGDDGEFEQRYTREMIELTNKRRRQADALIDLLKKHGAKKR